MSALAGPKRLILVEGAGHNESLRQESIWLDIDKWIKQSAMRQQFTNLPVLDAVQRVSLS